MENEHSRKTTLILTSIIIGIVAILAVYFILILTGVLQSREYSITVSTESRSKQYDGEALTCDGWKLEGDLRSPEHTLKVIVTGSITEVGKCDNNASVYVYDKDGNDITSSYNVNIAPGTLEIRRWPITVYSKGANKVYDGEPLTCAEVGHESGELMAGHGLVMEAIGSITNVGKASNQMTVKVIDANGNDVTDFYEIIKNLGDLVVSAPFIESDTLYTPIGEVEVSGDITLKPNTEGLGYPRSLEMFTFKTDLEERVRIYFKASSYGDYDGQGFKKPPTYVYSGDINPLYAPAEAVKNILDKSDVTITLKNLGSYIHPYFTLQTEGMYKGESDGVMYGTYTGKDTYSLSMIYFDYLTGNVPTSGGVIEEYNDFVKDNFLTISDSLKSTLLNLEDFDPDGKRGKELIKYIAEYVQSSARYNLEFAPFPEGVDPVVYFFTGSEVEGICQHYAMAGTMLYRACGIPARYTVGFVGDNIPNTEVSVDDSKCHAWVEIYLESFGWVPIEVTASNSAGGTGDVEMPGEPDFDLSGGELFGGGIDIANLPGSIKSPTGEEMFSFSTDLKKKVNLYFRSKSFGDYTGGAFGAPIVYTDGGAQYLPSSNLVSSVTPSSFDIYLKALDSYVEPYYTNGFDLPYAGESYSLTSYYFDYLTDKKVTLQDLTPSEYDEFVYSNYLTIDEELKSILLNLSDFNAEGKTGKEFIEYIAEYVRNSAIYNLDFQSYPREIDPVLYFFLGDNVEGICQHFAMAGTMLYRAHGIPARYTIGFVEANDPKEDVISVSDERGHAWVEIYIDGFGWVPVEVTAGLIEPPKVELEITTGSTIEGTHLMYSGQPMKLDEYTYDVTLLKEGHVVVPAEAWKEITDVGAIDNNMTFVILDESGEDVTDEYEITVVPGRVTVVAREMLLRTKDLFFRYTGETYYGGGEIEVLSGADDLDVALLEIVVDEGGFTAESDEPTEGENTVELEAIHVIYNGVDITDNCHIDVLFGDFSVVIG